MTRARPGAPWSWSRTSGRGRHRCTRGPRRHGCSSWPPRKRTPAGWRSFRTPRPADDTAWEQAAQAWASFLAEQALALEVPPVAGFVADDMRADSRTPFELAVDLVAEEVLGTDLLRQYSWLTLVGSGALQRLAG